MLSPRSSVVLIVANLLPIGGVLFFDWSVLELLLIYWAESVVIGVINVLRMLSSRADNPIAGITGRSSPASAAISQAINQPGARRVSQAFKFFLIPFFIMHYGAFCFAHLSAVVGLFSTGGMGIPTPDVVPAFSDRVFWFVVGSIFLSHLFSFATNFIGRGEYLRTGAGALMQRPYGRIMVMHITVIAGAALVDWLNNPLPMLIVLVICKTVVDLRMHNRERQRFADETTLPV